MDTIFDNTEIAFAPKTNAQLKKARFLFKTMGTPWLVQLGTRITPWALKVGLPIRGIIKKTIFAQFVGGETLAETAIVAQKLGESEVDVILDYGVEGKEGEDNFDATAIAFIEVLSHAATERNIPFISIKVTGFARFALLEKMAKGHGVNNSTKLTADEEMEWERVVVRMEKICEAAQQKNIAILVDAEESWIQDPVDRLTMTMMEKYNKSLPIVYNTIQLYRHDRLAFMKMCHQIALSKNYILGLKIVRGAYMEKERKRAEAMSYASPIQPNKEACDKDYNQAVDFCISNIKTISCVVASHNEESNFIALELLNTNEVHHANKHIHFSQLYGMSDNITFNLAKEGCNVSKYLPFGPIHDVIPYLMRRAQENTSVSGQTGRELGLIQKELERRKIG
jgi:proline dehydrogenase